MADNVTNPSTVTIGTNDVSGVHYQKHKLVDGTTGGTAGIPGSALGLYVDVRNHAQCSARTVVAVPLNVSSTTLKAANAARRGLIIHNAGSTTLYVIYGATASSSLFSFPLFTGDTFFMDPEDIDPGPISGIWAGAGSGSAMVTEQT